MGDIVSPELNQGSPDKDQIRSGKNPDKSAGRLIKGIRNALLTGLALSPSVINDTNISTTNIKDPTPVSAPLPENTSHNTDTLQPYMPQRSTETSTLKPTPDTPVDIRKTSKVEQKFIDNMKSKYGLKVDLYLILPDATKAIYGAQTLTEDEIHEIERSINLMPYCPKNFYNKLIIEKVPEKEPYLLGIAQYQFGYIELNIRGNASHMKKLFEGKTFPVQEPLGKVLAHECAHMINYRIMHLSATNYPDTSEGKFNFFRDMQKIPENTNPLYVIFSELTNWQFDGAKYKKASNDPRIKDEYYSGSIDEFMAEMFAMFKYRPDLLTSQESTFFKNLENGVSKEGDKFFKKVIENPKILLEN